MDEVRGTQAAEYQRLYAEAFGSGAACSIETSNESETGIVEVKQGLGGVFIIYGVVCAFVLLCVPSSKRCTTP